MILNQHNGACSELRDTCMTSTSDIDDKESTHSILHSLIDDEVKAFNATGYLHQK